MWEMELGRGNWSMIYSMFPPFQNPMHARQTAKLIFFLNSVTEQETRCVYVCMQEERERLKRKSCISNWYDIYIRSEKAACYYLMLMTENTSLESCGSWCVSMETVVSVSNGPIVNWLLYFCVSWNFKGGGESHVISLSGVEKVVMWNIVAIPITHKPLV